jgi:hypothetical protein
MICEGEIEHLNLIAVAHSREGVVFKYPLAKVLDGAQVTCCSRVVEAS